MRIGVGIAINHRVRTVRDDSKQRSPHQRKAQRAHLAILIATMLQSRSANIMVSAASVQRISWQVGAPSV
jgi:hypothetical protein